MANKRPSLRLEDSDQEAVIEYCEIRGIPIVHIPNEGKRTVSYGAKLRRMGMKKGFPDLFIPKAAKGKHGLFIEGESNGRAGRMALASEPRGIRRRSVLRI